MERWLIQSNIARLRIVQQTADLTEAEHRALERLEAQEQGKLRDLAVPIHHGNAVRRQ
jgi:hypothetical protein